MFICLFICTQIIYIAAEVYRDPVFGQSDQNSQHVWHSYNFNTGTGNREELQFSKVGLDKNFASANGEFMWKSLQVQEEIVIAGLGTDFLLITTYNKENDSFTYKEDLNGPAVYHTMFQKWDVRSQQINSYVIVAINKTGDNFVLRWYQVQNSKLKFLWDWPFHRVVTHINVIKINHESKLLVVSHKSGIHKNPSADIYSFTVGSYLDIWLFEKIILDEIPSSIAVFDNNDYTFLSASFPSLEMIHIFKYSRSLCLENSEQKHFMSHQKLFAVGLKSLISFRVGFRWYLAVASKTSSIYHINENLAFQPVNDLRLGSFNYWLAIPVDTYREDTILLGDSDSDVSIIAWTGNENLKVIGSFTQLGCEDDTDCLEKMNRVSLKGSTAFDFNGHQNIIISTEDGTPLLFKLLLKLKPLPDTVTLKLHEILETQNNLEGFYKYQNEQIDQLLRSNSKQTENSDEMSKTRSPIFFPTTQKSSESLTKNWTEILSTVNKLKQTVNSLSVDVGKLKVEIKSNMSLDDKQNLNSFLPWNVSDGITFYGNVLINELNLSTINGYDADELLEDSFRKSKMKKIGGTKTLMSLNVENILFEKMRDMLACNIVFSDDAWEESKHVLNGDVVWEGKLNVLNDVILIPDARNISSSNVKSETFKNFYDTLNLEELEINKETYVQETINGQPFILPVHNAHLNIQYLDIVNQARVEIVNVEGNLTVEMINGKNFSHLVENMVFKTFQKGPYNNIKIDGALSTGDLQTNQLNYFDLVPGSESDSDEQSPQSASYRTKRELNSSSNLKRTIHVFQYLEITGTLLTEKINNVSWDYLNDTVKKNEEKSYLNSVKTFKTSLKTRGINVTGPLNGRFVDNILTNSSDQIIRFPQTFDRVKFENLYLDGFWDGVCVECLNRTAVRVNSNEGHASNLTFEGECEFNVLNVLENVNDVGLSKNHNRTSGNKIRMKAIRAPKITLHGSLITNNKINDVNLTNFEEVRVSLNYPETVERDISHDNLTVTETLDLFSLNSNDVSSIINSRGDTKLIEEFLNGETHRIKKLLVKGNVSTVEGVNGFNVSRILEKGVRITKPNAIKGNVIFENVVHFNDINVTDSIDGFSLKKLEKDIVFENGHVFLTGAKNFSTIKVTNDMKARSLNGHLVQDIVTLKGDQTMKGPVKVNGNVIVLGNVTTYGAINDVTVPNLLRSFSTRFNSYIYTGDLSLRSDVVTIDNLFVGGDIQNISLDALIGDSIRREDGFKVTGKKSFKGEVRFNQNVFTEGLIDGLNFSKFASDVVFVNQPVKMEGKLTITEAVLKVLETRDYFNASLINNFDTNDWFEDSIPLDRYEVVSGKKTFEQVEVSEDVSVDFINDHLSSATVSLKEKQFIPALALFPRIHSVSDLLVTGSVNEKNLMEEFKDTILLTGSQTISGNTVFKKDFVVTGDLFVDTIKGRPVDRLVTLDTEQNIRTPLEFAGMVSAKQGVEKLKFINNISLHDWNEKSVSLDKEQVLNGLWTVRGRIKAKNIEGEGLLDTVSLPNVSKDVRNGRMMALELKNETEREYATQCDRIKELSKQFTRLPYLFHQFEIAHEIETLSVIDSVIPFKIKSENYMIVTFANECFSLLYRWNKDDSIFIYTKKINIGPVNKWLVAYRDEATYLITSYLKNSISCERNLLQGNVWVFEGESDGYVHLVTTNAFVDMTQENSTADKFFTLDESGSLREWIFEEGTNVTSTVVMEVGQGNYRFVDFRITGGLAVTNGREIKQIKDQSGSNNLSFLNAHIVALPLDGQTLAALVVKDKIVIYENLLEEKIFSVIHTYRASSVQWFNYGPEKQAFLIFASHHKLIEVYEYKSLVKKQSIQMFSSKLQSVALPSAGKYQLNKFLVVIQKKKIIFLEADMLGDFFQGSDSLC